MKKHSSSDTSKQPSHSHKRPRLRMTHLMGHQNNPPKCRPCLSTQVKYHKRSRTTSPTCSHRGHHLHKEPGSSIVRLQDPRKGPGPPISCEGPRPMAGSTHPHKGPCPHKGPKCDPRQSAIRAIRWKLEGLIFHRGTADPSTDTAQPLRRRPPHASDRPSRGSLVLSATNGQ